MEVLQMNNQVLTKHISNIQRELQQAKDANSYSEKQRKIASLKEELNSLQNEIQIFEIDICNANETHREKFKPIFEQYQEDANTLQREIQNLEQQQFQNPEREQFMPQERSLGNMEKQELIDHVDNKFDEANQAIDQGRQDLMEAKTLMQEINEEVKRQQEILNRMHEDIEETYSLTKQTKKQISYFKKTIMTDKLLCCCLIMIIILILVIIILKFMGFQSDDFNDVLKF